MPPTSYPVVPSGGR